MKIAIGCDHGGIELKEAVLCVLAEKGIEVCDCGTFDTQSCDYPDFAQKVAEGVGSGEFARGILLCGTGIGISIAANKVPKVRAAVCHDMYTAQMCAAHNNANILCMGARVISADDAQNMVRIWMDTPFEAGRHCGRVDKISAIEAKYCK